MNCSGGNTSRCLSFRVLVAGLGAAMFSPLVEAAERTVSGRRDRDPQRRHSAASRRR